jgi:hypothetical protein
MRNSQLIFCFDDSEVLPSDVTLVITPRNYFQTNNGISDSFGDHDWNTPSWIYEINGCSYFEVVFGDIEMPEHIKTKEDIKNELVKMGLEYSESLNQFINNGEDWHTDNVRIVHPNEMVNTLEALDKLGLRIDENRQVVKKEEPRKKKFWD